MSNKYRLLKDLPVCKAGTIFHKYSNNAIDYVALDVSWKSSGDSSLRELFLDMQFVENNPEWFKLVKEKATITIMNHSPYENALGMFHCLCKELGILIPDSKYTYDDLEKAFYSGREKEYPRPGTTMFNDFNKYNSFKDYIKTIQ